MANKLPWFTHDHSARNDEFMQKAEDLFGPFGYAAYFKILEMIHEHGVGGVLTMSRSRVCLNLRSRWPVVERYLDFSQTSGKLHFNLSGDEVRLENKKFIERQRKMKSKAPAMLLQSSSKAPIEGEEEGDKKKKEITTTATGIEADKEPKQEALQASFEAFWLLCPKKVGKSAALKAWLRAMVSPEVIAKACAAMIAQASSADWKKEGGKYIPHPATWINGARWEDETVAKPRSQYDDLVR